MQNIIEDYRAKVDKTYTYNLAKPVDVVRYAIRQRFSWPGGYELLVDYSDGSTLCSGCLSERARIELATAKTLDPVTERTFLYSSADIDPETVYCDHCNKDCSAYAEH